MKRSLEFWNFILTNLCADNNVALIKVFESNGASPGKQGFMLAVNDKKDIYGTVGGGIMEYDGVERSVEKLLANDSSISVRELQHKIRVPNSSGLMCSGVQTNADFTLSDKDIPVVEKILAALESREDGLLRFTPRGLEFDASKTNPQQYSYRFTSEQDWLFEENYGHPDTIYVFGGGHVGLAICQIFAALDFYVVVFDERPDALTMKKNTFAHEKIVGPFEEGGKYVQEGNHSYVIISTSKAPTDLLSLEQVIDKKVRYKGLMGSGVKIKWIYKKLTEKGISPDLFQDVHAPVGIPIESNTPEEIAVSIAAEIIKIKNTAQQ